MSPEQARAARAMLRIGVRDVASSVGVTPNTVSRIEAPIEDGKRGPQSSTVSAIKAWYEAAGIEFIAENGGGAGVRFRERRG